jgi:hypothetical protein
MIDRKEREELIAYLEGCALKGGGFDLPGDLVEQLLGALRTQSEVRTWGISHANEIYAFRVDVWLQNGEFEAHFGGSNDERAARAMFLEAVKCSPDRKVTLSAGPDVLKQSTQL